MKDAFQIESLAAWLILLIFPLASAGQRPDLQDLTSLSVEDLSGVRLSTASRHLADPRKAPAVVTTIDSEEIKLQGWRTLADLLRSVPGFYTAYDRTYSYIGVRGFLQSGDYNARILLLVDGHRINDAIYDGALVGTEFPLDMSRIDRVEIVRGPGSSLFGTNAELAVVNVYTKRPDKQDSIQVASETRSTMGRVAEANASFHLADVDGLVSGSLYRSNGAAHLYFPEFDLPESNNGVADNLDGDRYAHAFGMLRKGQFRVEGMFGTRHKIVPNASYGTIFSDPANTSVDTRGYVDATYSHQFGPNTDLDLRVYYDAYRWKGSYPYLMGEPPERAVQMNDGTSDGIGFESVVGRRLGRHRIVAGGSTEYSFRIHQRNYYVGQPAFLDDHRRLTVAAAFGEAELNPYKWLSLNVGGRLDWYSSYGWSFSPRIAAMMFPTKNTTLKYIYGHAFRAPDPYDEFYVDQIDITATNTRLVPEAINSHTFLVEHSLKPWLRVAADGFANDLTQIIEETQDSSTGETHFANLPGDKARGLELELSAKSASGWTARSSYVFERAKSDARQRTMNSPNHLAKFDGVAPLSRYSLLGLEVLYTGSQPNFQNQHILSSLLTNLTVSTPSLHNGWELSGGFYNLLDHRWSTPTGPEIAAPATVQDGRSFRFRVSYRWSKEKQSW